MASHTKVTKARRRLRRSKAGRRRKSVMARRSTLSSQELFANCGEPGQPAPKQS